MKSFRFFFASSIIATVVTSLTLERRDNPQILSLQFKREFVESESSVVRKRQTGLTVPVSFAEGAILYNLEIGLGTPPQTVNVQLDTGSSDLVVLTPGTGICVTIGGTCVNEGDFDPRLSSTYQPVSNNLFIAYASGDTATGDYGTDVLALQGAVLPQFQFGLMYVTTLAVGIFGIGFPENEAITAQPNGIQYPNLPNVLRDQGIIAARAYSIWLNDITAAAGTVLFGGIDTTKYYGNLVTIGLTSTTDFLIPLLRVEAIGASGTVQQLDGGDAPGDAILDTGSTNIRLPTDVLQAVYIAFGATFPIQFSSTPYVPCALADSPAALVFTFQGIKITTPMRQMMLAPEAGSQICQFLVSPISTYINLGDAFLRSVYVVYDLDNAQVSMAPTVYGATTSNVIQIVPGPIPNVPGANSPQSSAALSSSNLPSSSAAISSSVISSSIISSLAVSSSIISSLAVSSSIISSLAVSSSTSVPPSSSSISPSASPSSSLLAGSAILSTPSAAPSSSTASASSSITSSVDPSSLSASSSLISSTGSLSISISIPASSSLESSSISSPVLLQSSFIASLSISASALISSSLSSSAIGASQSQASFVSLASSPSLLPGSSISVSNVNSEQISESTSNAVLPISSMPTSDAVLPRSTFSVSSAAISQTSVGSSQSSIGPSQAQFSVPTFAIASSSAVVISDIPVPSDSSLSPSASTSSLLGSLSVALSTATVSIGSSVTLALSSDISLVPLSSSIQASLSSLTLSTQTSAMQSIAPSQAISPSVLQSSLPSSSSSVLPVSTAGLDPTGENTCGPQNNNYTCASNRCCSAYGYCGRSSAYCGVGCNPLFGRCNTPTQADVTRPTDTTNRGRCGPQTGLYCPGTQCCSRYGYCGKRRAYCARGCQSAFGRCN